MARCKLTNMNLRNIRKTREYQCLLIDLVKTGVVGKSAAEGLLGYTIPAGLLEGASPVVPDEEESGDTVTVNVYGIDTRYDLNQQTGEWFNYHNSECQPGSMSIGADTTFQDILDFATENCQLADGDRIGFDFNSLIIIQAGNGEIVNDIVGKGEPAFQGYRFNLESSSYDICRSESDWANVKANYDLSELEGAVILAGYCEPVETVEEG